MAATKKAAKHLACEHVLKQILDGVGGYAWDKTDEVLEGWVYEGDNRAAAAEPVLAPEDSLNYIGALNEFCDRMTPSAVAGPQYEDLDEGEKGSEQRFAVKCNMYFLKDDQRVLTTTGHGKTKKSAKRRSAALMHELLVKQGHDVPIAAIEYHRALQGVGSAGQVIELGAGDAQPRALTPVVKELPSAASPSAKDYWGDSDDFTVVVTAKDPDQTPVAVGAATAAVDSNGSNGSNGNNSPFQELETLARRLSLSLIVDEKSGPGYKCVIEAKSRLASASRVGVAESVVSPEEAKQEAARSLLTSIRDA